jgi:hypothetical protein
VLEKTLVIYLQKLPETDKAAFAQASKIVYEQTRSEGLRRARHIVRESKELVYC